MTLRQSMVIVVAAAMLSAAILFATLQLAPVDQANARGSDRDLA